MHFVEMNIVNEMAPRSILAKPSCVHGKYGIAQSCILGVLEVLLARAHHQQIDTFCHTMNIVACIKYFKCTLSISLISYSYIRQFKPYYYLMLWV